VVFNGITTQATAYGTGFTGSVTSMALEPLGGGAPLPLQFTTSALRPGQVQVWCRAGRPRAGTSSPSPTARLRRAPGRRADHRGPGDAAARHARGDAGLRPHRRADGRHHRRGERRLPPGAARLPEPHQRHRHDGGRSGGRGQLPLGLAPHGPGAHHGLFRSAATTSSSSTRRPVGVATAAFKVVALPPRPWRRSLRQRLQREPADLHIEGKDFRQPAVTLSCVDGAGADLATNPPRW